MPFMCYKNTKTLRLFDQQLVQFFKLALIYRVTFRILRKLNVAFWDFQLVLNPDLYECNFSSLQDISKYLKILTLKTPRPIHIVMIKYFRNIYNP